MCAKKFIFKEMKAKQRHAKQFRPTNRILILGQRHKNPKSGNIVANEQRGKIVAMRHTRGKKLPAIFGQSINNSLFSIVFFSINDYSLRMIACLNTEESRDILHKTDVNPDFRVLKYDFKPP